MGAHGQVKNNALLSCMYTQSIIEERVVGWWLWLVVYVVVCIFVLLLLVVVVEVEYIYFFFVAAPTISKNAQGRALWLEVMYKGISVGR